MGKRMINEWRNRWINGSNIKHQIVPNHVYNLGSSWLKRRFHNTYNHWNIQVVLIYTRLLLRFFLFWITASHLLSNIQITLMHVQMICLIGIPVRTFAFCSLPTLLARTTREICGYINNARFIRNSNLTVLSTNMATQILTLSRKMNYHELTSPWVASRWS